MPREECKTVVIQRSAAIAISIGFILLGVIAVFGNLIIIISVIRNPLKKLHTPFNYFLVNLSVCDFVTGAVAMPLTAYYIYSKRNGVYLTFSRIELCVTTTLAASVILSTCALVIDRLIGITRPLKYRQHLSWGKCVALSLLIWVLSVSVGLILTYAGNRRDAFMGFYCSAISCGLIVITIGFFKVYMFLRNHEQEFRKRLEESITASEQTILQRCKTEKKVTRAFLIILAVFVLSYVPGLAFLNVMFYCHDCNCQLLYSLYHIRYLLSVANSSVNPIIFTLLLKDFRLSVKALFTRKEIASTINGNIS